MAELDSQRDIDAGRSGKVRYWLREIELATRKERDWRERAKKIVARYRDDERITQGGATVEVAKRFNILFSNTQVLHAAIYNKPPSPDVRRRWLSKDRIGRIAAMVLQRAVDFSLDTPQCDANAAFSSNVLDTLLTGRGVSRVYYRPFFQPGDPVRVDVNPLEWDGETGQPTRFPKEITVEDHSIPIDTKDVRLDERGYHTQVPGPDKLVYEMVGVEEIDWEYYRQSPARSWREVRWVAYGKLLTRDEIRSQFGREKAEGITLDHVPSAFKDDPGSDAQYEMFKKALVWEIWDRKTRKVHVVSNGLKSDFLAVWDDPLELEAFFPNPKPMMFLKTTTSLVPMPEYLEYQDQALELDDLTNRIDKLTSALRMRGVYDASIDGLQDLADARDNNYVPIEDWVGLQTKGGLQKVWEEMPIDQVANVLIGLYDAREKVKNDIYEIIGMPDILRGASKATETYGAQRIKSESASLRIQPRQSEVQRFIRDTIRLMAEVVANHFHPETLSEISQQPVLPQVIELLRSDKLRGFSVDIEADSTLKPNMEIEQNNRIQLLQAVGGFVKEIGPAVEAGYIDEKVAKEILVFGIQAFRTGPELEAILDEYTDPNRGLEAPQGQEQGPAPQRPSNPKQQEMTLRAQESAQSHQIRQAELGLEARRLQLDEAKHAHEVGKTQMEHAQAMAGHQTELMQEAGTVAPVFREIAQMIAQSAQQNAQAMGALGQFMNRLAELQMQTIAEIRKPKVATSTRTPTGMRAVIQSQENLQ